MPRNVSRSPHELVTYTLRFIFTLRACSKGRADSGRSYRVKSEINLISARAAEKSAALFLFALAGEGSFLLHVTCPHGNGYSCTSAIGKSLRLSVTSAQPRSIVMAAIIASSSVKVRPFLAQL